MRDIFKDVYSFYLSTLFSTNSTALTSLTPPCLFLSPHLWCFCMKLWLPHGKVGIFTDIAKRFVVLCIRVPLFDSTNSYKYLVVYHCVLSQFYYNHRPASSVTDSEKASASIRCELPKQIGVRSGISWWSVGTSHQTGVLVGHLIPTLRLKPETRDSCLGEELIDFTESRTNYLGKRLILSL